MNEITFSFQTLDAAELFAEWIFGQGEQDFVNYQRNLNVPEDKQITCFDYVDNCTIEART